MKNRVFLSFIAFFVFMGVVPVSGEVVGSLPEVLKPSNIAVAKNRLFVMDAGKIRIYSIPDLKLINTFGKEGEGPGEYKLNIALPLRLKIHKDSLLVESVDKLMHFSLEGKYQREIKKDFFLIFLTPVKENFVARRIVQAQDRSTEATVMVGIYDKDLKLIKELYKQRFLQQGAGPGSRLDMGQDFLNFRVYKDKIFIEESHKGFYIEVFDVNGNKLYHIDKDVDPEKITLSRKEKLIEDMKTDPHIVRQMKQGGFSWEDLTKIITLDFPDHFPVIRNIEVGNDRIYVQTHKEAEGKQEYFILDLKGKELKKLMIPEFQKQHLMSTMLGIRLSTMSDGKIYYVEENEDEEWELHQVNID